MVETRSQTNLANQQQAAARQDEQGRGDNSLVDGNGSRSSREGSHSPSDPPPPDTIWSKLGRMLESAWDWFNNSPPLLKAGVIGFLIMSIVSFWASVGGESPSAVRESTILSFEESYKILTAHFPSQSEETMDSLKVAMKHILDGKDPRDPSSMIVLIPPTLASTSFPTCFIQVFGKMLNRVFHPNSPLPVMWMNETTFKGANISSIHSDLRNYFHHGGASVIVSQIHNFAQEEYLTVFHAFCDSTHAPVKRAAYFFLVPIPSSMYNPHGWNDEVTSLGNDILESAWGRVLHWDKIHPLLARIGSWGTILLKEGDSCNPKWEI